MIFKETKLKDAYIIEMEPIEDERGFFARSFCTKEFEAHGIIMNVVQCNISYNNIKGTLRGMHYQEAPYEEAKLVSCIKGAIYDVIIDLREDSATYCQWVGVELTAHGSPLTAYCSRLTACPQMFYIPKGFAHGFITLSDDTEVFYQMSEVYSPDHARGVRWNDPAFGIRWPEKVQLISARDDNFPDFKANR